MIKNNCREKLLNVDVGFFSKKGNLNNSLYIKNSNILEVHERKKRFQYFIHILKYNPYIPFLRIFLK